MISSNRIYESFIAKQRTQEESDLILKTCTRFLFLVQVVGRHFHVALPVTVKFGFILIYAVKFSETVVEKIVIDNEIAEPDVVEQGREQKAKNQAIFNGYPQKKNLCKDTFLIEEGSDLYQFFGIPKGEKTTFPSNFYIFVP